MNNFFEQLKNEGQKLGLSHAEKSAMKAAVFDAARPYPTGHSAPSPYFFFDFQFMQRAFVPLLAVLVILGGTGTAYAAEGSLPGSPLYPIKVGVVEPVRAALAVSSEARAEVHIALAQKRVEEAEVLASEGKLTASTTQELQDNFEAHVAMANELALEVGHDDPAAAVEIEARSRSSLAVHGAILASLSNKSENHDSKTNSSALAARVLARVAVAEAPVPQAAAATTRAAFKVATVPVPASEPSTFAVQTFAVTATDTNMSDSAAGASASAEGVVVATPTPAVPPQPQEDMRERNSEESKLKARAAEALRKAHKQYDAIKADIDAEVAARLDAQFKEATVLSTDGSYSDALKLAVKLQAILEAQKKYKGDVISPLLELRLNGRDD